MKTRFSEMVGVDFPLVAFSHCRDVVAAVSKAGGFGVLGASTFTPEELKVELDWIDAHIDGRPYGVDLAIPENMAVKHEVGLTNHAIWGRIPEDYRRAMDELLLRYDIDPSISVRSDAERDVSLMGDAAERLMDVVFRHPIRLVVQALGLPPHALVDRARSHKVPLGALIGSADHAQRQLDVGVEVLVAQGTEAGGHCGEVSTMVMVPEVVRAVDTSKVSVLAAGGIVTGRQMAAAMAMGADGVWTGSVWLTTTESEVSPVVRDKLLAAKSRDTVRSRATSGKMCRQLRSAWTETWEAPGSLPVLPMPMQPELGYYVLERATKSAEAGNEKARQVVNYLVGQGVGMIDTSKSARAVVQEFMEDFVQAGERMQELLA